MNKKLLLSILLFSAFILSFTFNDKLVHNDAYIDTPTLQYTDRWLNQYWINYFVMYELVIVATTTICMNKWFFIFTQIFTIFTTQDIIFFLWVGYFPTEEWTWIWQYHIFGTWTTELQFITSILSLSVIVVFYVLFKKKNKQKNN